MENSFGFDTVKQVTQQSISSIETIAKLIGDVTTDELTLPSGEHLIPGLGMYEDSRILKVRAQDMKEGIFKLLILGDFKNGKSTLINSMLGDETLPTKAVKCTAIITVLVAGNERTVTIHEENKADRKLTIEEFYSEFQLYPQDEETYLTQNYIDRFKDVKFAEIESSNKLVSNSVRLVDSPGLADSITRTRMVTSFFPEANAVIMVLDAAKALSQSEREFITSHFTPGNVDHIFFVVNRINLIRKKDIDEVKESFSVFLAPLFRDGKTGQIDNDLFSRRLFYVDALTALDERTEGDNDQETLEQTGVPALERELEKFLTGHERVKAVVDSTKQAIDPIIDNALNWIEQETKTIAEPIQELEKRRKAAEGELRELENKKDDMEKTILLFRDMIKGKIISDLQTYFRKMEKEFPEESKQYLELENVGLWAMLSSTFSESKSEEIKAAIENETKQYLQIQFDNWSKAIPQLISSDIEKLKKQMDQQIFEFSSSLVNISEMFASGFTVGSTNNDKKVNKAIQIGLSVLTLDVSGLSGSMLGQGDWGHFIGRLVTDQIIFAILATLLGPIGIPVYILTEGIHMKLQANEKKQKLRENIGKNLFSTLTEKLPEFQDTIYSKIDTRFNEFANNMTGTLQAKIDDVRNEQIKIIEEKRSESFSVEKKKNNLDKISNCLQEYQAKFEKFDFI